MLAAAAVRDGLTFVSANPQLSTRPLTSRVSTRGMGSSPRLDSAVQASVAIHQSSHQPLDETRKYKYFYFTPIFCVIVRIRFDLTHSTAAGAASCYHLYIYTIRNNFGSLCQCSQLRIKLYRFIVNIKEICKPFLSFCRS